MLSEISLKVCALVCVDFLSVLNLCAECMNVCALVCVDFLNLCSECMYALIF